MTPSSDKKGRPTTVFSTPGVTSPREYGRGSTEPPNRRLEDAKEPTPIPSTPGVSRHGEDKEGASALSEPERKKSRSRRRRRSRREESSKREPIQLGKTEGMVAVGAWAARAEIRALLEKGHSGRELLDSLRRGKEGEAPLDMSFGSRTGAEEPAKKRKANEQGLAASSEERAPLPRQQEGTIASVYSAPLGLSSIPTPPSVLASTHFKKKAAPPPTDHEINDRLSRSSQEDLANRAVDANEDERAEIHSSTLAESEIRFSKKATPPPPETEALFRDPPPPKAPVIRVPVRKDPRTVDKYAQYDELAKELFEDLVVRGVRMDLIDLIYCESEPSSLDEAKFQVYTDPRSPDTGIRYGRLLRRYLAWIGDSTEKTEVFESDPIGGFLQSLISEKAGMRTPQAFLYALEFFSVIFGFQMNKAGFRRWRKMADDYARSAPPSSPAPFMGVPFLKYLEGVVLDENRPTHERVTSGKLRLCAQASIRHSDLTRTPLREVQWCREVGSERSLGIRAKAPVTKSGPMPWVASHLGTVPENDSWLVAFMNLMLKSHGRSWKTHEFFGCALLKEGEFAEYPSTLAADVEMLRRMLLKDLEREVEVPLTKEASLSFRWHSAKSLRCLTDRAVWARGLQICGSLLRTECTAESSGGGPCWGIPRSTEEQPSRPPGNIQWEK